MTISDRLLVNRFSILVCFGLFAGLINEWATNNPSEYEVLLDGIYLVVSLLVLISDVVKGNLKSSPIYRATYQEAVNVQYVQFFIALYLMVIALLIVVKAFNSTIVYKNIFSPFNLYIAIAPILTAVFFGKYAIEKNENVNE